MATAYTYLILMLATLLLASVNSVNSNHIGCLSVGYEYDTVKHAKYHC